MKRFWSVLFWSVIAAAFIGPGTVTTAAKAGAGFGFSLLWALAFSSIACLLLQEAAARITVVSGRDLGQALRERYCEGLSAIIMLVLVFGAIVLGCAAYEAGNILGGVAGAALGTGLPPTLLTIFCGAGAAALLWLGAPRTVARALGIFVAVMGVAFLVTALWLKPAPLEVARGSLVPTFPEGSGLVILGLIGTTVVPYNLFLGSGLARGQSLSELRFGLAVAVLLGGVISMSIVVVGAAVEGPFSFEALAGVLESRLGGWARSLFAAGLFAAGVSSAITAPLAAAITARSLFSSGRWGDRSWRFRAVWAAVLATGLGFGLAGLRPIPAILLAQAFNGVLLPLVAIFLLLTVNDRRLMGDDGINGPAANVPFGIIVAVTVALGFSGVARAAAATFDLTPPDEGRVLIGSAIVAALFAAPLWRAVAARRKGSGR
jgi:Mn2+/Fe2+ NRAMP family transporter